MAMLRSAIALFFLGALSGCARHLEAPEGVLRVQLSTEPVSLDPSLAEDGASIRVLANTWRGLDRLADPPQITHGGKRLVFHLKPEARWTDGVAVTAPQFVAGIRRSLAPATGAKLAPMLFPIQGAREYNSGKSTELPGVHAHGDQTLVLELETPAPYLLQALSLSIAMPLRQDVLDAHGGKWPPEAPSTGPFRLSAYVRGQKIVLTRVGPPPAGGPHEVDLLIVADESSGVNLFERGELDIMTRVPTLELGRLETRGVVHTDPFVATYYLGFNVKKSPFDRVEYRRAVSRAIRKRELADAVATGETPARSWLPPGIEGFLTWKDEPMSSEPPSKGALPKDLLVDASFDSSPRNSLVMEKVQDDVLRATGLKLSLSNLDWKSYIHSLQAGPTPIFRFAWLAPFLDPVPHLQVFTTGNPNNYTGWSNARYDRLVREIEQLQPGPERLSKVHAAQKILLEEDVVIVPLYHYVQNHAVSRRVKSFRVDPFGAIPFDEIRLSEKGVAE